MMGCPLLPGLALLAAALLGGMTAAAQPASETIEALPQRKVEKHVFNYGEMDGTCTRWTDQCRTCARTGDNERGDHGHEPPQPNRKPALEKALHDNLAAHGAHNRARYAG